MREYELTVLFHPDLESDLEKPLTKVRDIITNAGGKITTEDNWGKKRLAYPIKKEEFASYVYFELELPGDAPQAISNTLNITDEVMRYLLVAFDHKGRQALAEAEERAKNSDNEEE